MTTPRTRLLAGLLATACTLAACSSAISGNGSPGEGSSTAGTSTADFPTNTPAATTGAVTPTTPASTPTAPLSASGLHPAPATPLRSATVHAPDGRTYLVKVWADVKNATCYDHAYGQPMITFLTQHPCRGLDRVLGTTTVNGRPVAFAMSATSFTGTAKDPYGTSGAFSTLVEKDGTGNLNDLLREGYRLPSGPARVPYPDAFSVVGQDNGVTVWDVWYLDGSTPNNDKALVRMTQDIFLQF